LKNGLAMALQGKPWCSGLPRTYHRPTLYLAHNAEMISAIPSPKTLKRFFI
jgi:hypothetical protein